MESKKFKDFWESQTTPLHAHAQDPWFDRYAAEIKGYLPNQGTIVDAGCGSGEILFRLARYYHKIIAIDYSESMLTQAKEKVKNQHSSIDFFCGSVVDIKLFCPITVDAIYCNGVVQYLSKAELAKFVKDSLELLAPHGNLIILQIPNINCRMLFRLGFYRHEKQVAFSKILKGLLALSIQYIKNGFRKVDDGIGNWYSIEEVKILAQSLNANAEVYGSMFVNYNYRFHVVISKN